MFNLRQGNRQTESESNHNKQVLARLSDGHNDTLKPSGEVDDLNSTKLFQAQNSCGKQDQNAVQQIVCDDEVVFKTADSRKLPV